MFNHAEMLQFLYSSFWKKFMNLNEDCLLNFLINPDELKDLSDFFVNCIEEIEKNIINSDN